jgi:hypothetical protein
MLTIRCPKCGKQSQIPADPAVDCVCCPGCSADVPLTNEGIEGKAKPAPSSRRRGIPILAVLAIAAVIAVFGVKFIIDVADEVAARRNAPGSSNLGNAQWKTFTSHEHGFSVSFPDEPEKTVKQGPGGDTTYFLVGVEGGLITYAVMVLESPVDLSPEAMKGLDGAVAQFGKAVKSRSDVQIKGYPGIELALEIEKPNGPLDVTQRTYIVKKSMYQVMAGSIPSKKDATQSQRFLDSFTLLEDVAAESGRTK